jgi:hypothetical protein
VPGIDYEKLDWTTLKGLASFSGNGEKRIVLRSTKAGFVAVSAMADKGLAKNTLYTENALVVEAIEHCLIKEGEHRLDKKKQVSACLFYLSLYHQGAAGMTQAGLANLYRIHASSDDTVKQFLLLQSLALKVSKDARFVALVKVADPGKKRSAASRFTDVDKRWNIFNNLLGIVVPPFGLGRLCWRLCTASDTTRAYSNIKDLARLLGSPLPELLASVKSQESYNQEVVLAFTAAFTLITSAIHPGALVFPLGVTHFVPSLATSVIQFQSSAYILSPSKFAIKKMLFAVGETMLKQKGGGSMGVPVFPVRRGADSETHTHTAGRDKLYSLTDGKLINALIAYLAPPMDPRFSLPKNNARQTNPELFQQEEARMIIRNLLGSPNFEDCNTPIDTYMKPLEYISERLNVGGTDTRSEANFGPDHWRGVRERKKPGNDIRPVSFLRLLLVAGGGAPRADDKIYVDGGGFRSQMASLWRASPQGGWAATHRLDAGETHFDDLGEHHPALDYFVPPWQGFLPKSVAEVDTKIGFKFEGSTALDYDEYRLMWEWKRRWRADAEGMNCVVCATNLDSIRWKGYRHHCRLCGHHVCSNHASKKNKVALRSRDTGKPSSEFVCDNCREKRPDVRRFAMRPGDVSFEVPGPGDSAAQGRGRGGQMMGRPRSKSLF